MAKKGPVPRPPEERFWGRVDKTDTCWLWTGGNNGRYGVFFPGGCNRQGGNVYAHRWVYEYVNGEIAEGMQVNHLCEVPMCVRPDHLEAVTPKENMRYGASPTAKKAAQTHCVNGHEFTEENTYIRANGCRKCRTCHARTEDNRRRRARGEEPRA